MENIPPNWAEEALAKFSLEDKIYAAGIITYDHDLFYKEPKDLTETQVAHIDSVIRKHIYANGEQGVKMAIRVGKAMKASIDSPLKIKPSIGKFFKDKIKGLFS